MYCLVSNCDGEVRFNEVNPVSFPQDTQIQGLLDNIVTALRYISFQFFHRCFDDSTELSHDASHNLDSYLWIFQGS